MVALLVATLALGSLALAGASYALDRRFERSGELILRSEAQLAELRRLHHSRLDITRAGRIAEGGTRVVQGVHYGIAAIPFAILEAIPPTRPVTRVVHVTHDLIAGSVYGAISLASRALGRALRRQDWAPPRVG